MKKKLFEGFPSDISKSLEEIEKQQSRIKISTETRSYGKQVTIIRGIEDEEEAVKVLKELKQRLGCGGTYKNNQIELQGNHINKAIKILVELGYKEENIEVET